MYFLLFLKILEPFIYLLFMDILDNTSQHGKKSKMYTTSKNHLHSGLQKKSLWSNPVLFLKKLNFFPIRDGTKIMHERMNLKSFKRSFHSIVWHLKCQNLSKLLTIVNCWICSPKIILIRFDFFGLNQSVSALLPSSKYFEI